MIRVAHPDELELLLTQVASLAQHPIAFDAAIPGQSRAERPLPIVTPPRRLPAAKRRGDYLPTPDEIAAQAAVIRARRLELLIASDPKPEASPPHVYSLGVDG
jgi:hypothetical protein